MDHPHILQILHDLICGRNDFLNDIPRRIPFLNRPVVLARYMNNEAMILEFLNRAYTLESQARVAATSILSMMAVNPTFQEPVVVAPSQAQITASLENHPTTTSNCAICQEQIENGACRIRQCGHVYHRSCISNWFSMSVRCPVCRYDIREGDPVAQTSPASNETSSQ